MRGIFRRSKAGMALMAAFTFAVIGGNATAGTFTGGGDGTSWEDPLNWASGVVPVNGATGVIAIGGDFVDFDANTWAALTAAGNLQNATQYRVDRFLLNENTTALGSPGGITFDQGNGNQVLQTNGNSSIFGSRGNTTIVNVLSGSVNTGSNTTFGARNGTGILNLSGGQFIVGRGNLTLGQNPDGTGEFNITGGDLLTRGGAFISPNSTFEVVGTGAGQIGIGSQGSVDGFWDQAAGATIRSGVDSTGITPIFIDDVQGGAGAGIATFTAGSILDPFDAGGVATNVWFTVLEAENSILGAPTLSAAATAAGWISRVDSGNLLQVQLVATAIPEPSSLALLGLGGLFLTARRRK